MSYTREHSDFADAKRYQTLFRRLHVRVLAAVREHFVAAHEVEEGRAQTSATPGARRHVDLDAVEKILDLVLVSDFTEGDALELLVLGDPMIVPHHEPVRPTDAVHQSRFPFRSTGHGALHCCASTGEMLMRFQVGGQGCGVGVS